MLRHYRNNFFLLNDVVMVPQTCYNVTNEVRESHRHQGAPEAVVTSELLRQVCDVTLYLTTRP